jgi:RNase P subunit RPR2
MREKRGLIGLVENNLGDRKMRESKPIACQKCGKPLGYVTVLAKGLTSLQQPLRDVKLVAICLECAQKRK